MLMYSILYAIIFNIDSFGIGITYGLKNTKIPFTSACILFCITYISMVLAMKLGKSLSLFLPSFVIQYLGGALLIFIGIWFIGQSKRKKEETLVPSSCHSTTPISPKKDKVYSFFIRPLGITIEIIRNPISSDLDCSKKIESKEACFLGVAMSIDSIFSGIAASTLSINTFLFPFLVAFFQLIFLFVGMQSGAKIQSVSRISEKVWSILSGIMLILIGISRLY